MQPAPQPALSVWPLRGLPRVKPGDDLGRLLIDAICSEGLVPAAGDILVVAQKIVSKAEGRTVDVAAVTPSARAQELAEVTGKDPRLVELVLRESTEVLRAKRNVMIVAHRLGLVMANAGIDQSNVESSGLTEPALLLPIDPDASALRLKTRLEEHYGVPLGVVVSDSFGRAWRLGTTGVAIGAAGIPSLIDQRGETDMNGRVLMVTETAFADSIAAAAVLVMGEAAEGTPAALVRTPVRNAPERPARNLVRPGQEDMFR
ncbi:MAG: coenzyme F420-0:L-glutamate ligase [Hyphomicrobiaceae bacterium]|nr:coenzyme F420-0:L-glutamate ligase [Hyphomicrobiaceae bacterium]